MYEHCDKHNEPYEIKPNHGSWMCECPKCRAEGLLDFYTSNMTTPLPEKNGRQIIIQNR